MSKTTLVRVHWNTVEHGVVNTMMDGNMTETLYTQVTVYADRKRNHALERTHLLLFGAHLQLSENQPLSVEWDYDWLCGGGVVVPTKVFAKPHAKKPLLIWETPERLPRITAITEDSVTISGPESLRPVPTIVISDWPGDDWAHVYVPFNQAEAVLEAIRKAGFSAGPLDRQSQQPSGLFWVVIHVSYDNCDADLLETVTAAAQNGIQFYL